MGYQYEDIVAEPWKPNQPGDSIQGRIEEIGGYEYKGEIIPTISLIDPWGVTYSVSMSCYVLNQIYNHEALKVGGYLVLSYVGESRTIKKADNYAKMYRSAYFAPGDWSINEETDEIEGTQTFLGKSPKPPMKPYKGKKEHPKAKPLVRHEDEIDSALHGAEVIEETVRTESTP